MKTKNTYLAYAYDEVNRRKAERLRECAEWLEFARLDERGRLKLLHANFCRVRLCPMCQWRRSMKNFGQVCKVVEAMSGEGFKFLFVTLTMRNVSGAELGDAITDILSAFNLFAKYKEIKRAFVGGYYRGLEVTHNIDADTFHPHIHAIFGIRDDYYSAGNYLTQKRLTELWQRALGVDYTPIVHIEKCKGATVASVAEAAKYAAKADDYIIPLDWKLTVETVRILDAALDKRRLVAYGGRFKELHKLLNLSDPDDGDLINIDDDKINKGLPEELQSVFYYFNVGYMQYRKGEKK